eukprot:2771029-Prymnesium_polylepis.1
MHTAAALIRPMTPPSDTSSPRPRPTDRRASPPKRGAEHRASCPPGEGHLTRWPIQSSGRNARAPTV